MTTHLTKNGVKEMCEGPKDQKDVLFYVQITQIKHFDKPDDVKKSIRARIQVSDGTSTVLAMINKQTYDKIEGEIKVH